MSTPTLIPGDNKQDEERNIGQQHADDLARRYSHAERMPGTFTPTDSLEEDFANGSRASNGEDAPSTSEEYKAAREREAEAAKGAPQTSWDDKTTPSPKKVKGKGWFRKAAPALGIGGVFGIGGFLLIGLASPSLLIVQMKEVMVERFNTQLASMDITSNKLLVSKLNGATSGSCGKITVRCKFTSMSNKQVEKLKAAGIEVIPDEKTTITGRVKPVGLKFNGETIEPKNFIKTANSNTAFRSALKQAYNPKFAGFSGSPWAAVAARFKTNKKTPELNAAEDKEAARTKINQIAAEGVEDTSSKLTVDASDEDCKQNCTSKADADRINADTENLNSAGKSGAAAADVRARLSGLSTGAVVDGFKITSFLDNACMVYSATNALTYAGKAIRAAQLVRYFMIYASFADAIKAGVSPDPADIALLGEAATTVTKDAKDASKTVMGAATDSYGFKYASYGDAGASEQSMTIANRFIAGGGFVGVMGTAVSTVLAPLGGRASANATCGVLSNPFVQGASLLVGVAAFFVPGANVAKITVQAVSGIAVSVIIASLPSLLADIVAGTVTNDLKGEEVGNAMTSGAGALMSDALAGQNGNGLMTKDDAIAYNALQTSTTDQYIADELTETNPFDPYNRHTFVGSMIGTMLPLQSSSNPLSFIGSFLHLSTSSLVKKSNAATQQDYADTLEVCQDPDVLETGYAADPFCNPIRAIPMKYLESDTMGPLEVISTLENTGDIDSEGAIQPGYQSFIDKCITNEGPVGYSNLDAGFSPDEVKECIIDTENKAARYLFYQYNRVEAGMSGEDDEEAAPTDATNTGRPENTTDRNGGWTLTNNVDYSGTQCDPRTENAGTFTSPQYGWTIRLCKITYNTDGSGASNGGNQVSSLVSTNLLNMFEAANEEGIKLGLSDGMRKVPPSYFSMHSTGLAVDLGVPKNGQTICYGLSPWWINSREGYGSGAKAAEACNSVKSSNPAHYNAWQWLSAHATEYGFNNYVNEPWHYSTSGNGT